MTPWRRRSRARSSATQTPVRAAPTDGFTCSAVPSECQPMRKPPRPLHPIPPFVAPRYGETPEEDLEFRRVDGRQDPPDSVRPAPPGSWPRRSRVATIGTIAIKRKGPEVDLRALGRRGWTRTTTMLSHGTFAGAQFPAVGCGAGGRSSASSVRSRCVPAPRVLLPVVRSGADLLLARVRWPAEGGGPAPDQAAPLARLRRAVGHSPSDASPSGPSPGESDGHRSPRSCPCGERL
jgi:hypothetical protein